MDDPLDFEVEDDLLVPLPINNKRKKVIGLDDLLNDHYKEQEKLVEKQKKQARKKAKAKEKKKYDDEDRREAVLVRIVEKCHNQLKAFGEENEIQVWGVKVFGEQKPFPVLDFPDLGNCNFIQSFMKNKLNSMVELTVDKGDSFLESLLVNGWLSKLAFLSGLVEKPVAIWAFNTMLYSSKDELRNSSSDYWCTILSSRKEVDQLSVKIDWFPEYSDLRSALNIYGFLFKFSSISEHESSDSNHGGPPQNIRAWIRFVTSCCRIRNTKAFLTTVEAEEIVEIIICLFLDRRLQGLLVLLSECLQATVNYFTDQEWCTSCENIAKFIACRVSKDLNCIQVVECVSKDSSRCKQLRSAIAYQSLLHCFDEANSGEEIIRSLDEINFKEKSCNFFEIYIYLVLTENWVLSNNSFVEDNPEIYEMFCSFLRHCSTLISATDLRAYASKVRHKASYLLHFYV
ncbi:uncharacterized protein LOC131623194 isoform X2 [Vicia villosa]|uniref:uncharacterized protein LOC131623194 isoform X2 n=1 Tax=Vicia villosa TaxID=3911 RepID=UPI00273CB573|nr:uncharacterized protein LOC131623194 isoform X2 [Vicia villosa]